MSIDDKIDWRVGMASVSILRNFVEEYIKASTIKGKYEGKFEALIQYSELTDYLKKNE
ncbi:MAG: hypothetical protein NTV63_04095 [Candidatus Woesearchaeota archaeon]|nr:hypothetical protein [Candidatus Woesearchaeota archaeon]